MVFCRHNVSHVEMWSELKVEQPFQIEIQENKEKLQICHSCGRLIAGE